MRLVADGLIASRMLEYKTPKPSRDTKQRFSTLYPWHEPDHEPLARGYEAC